MEKQVTKVTHYAILIGINDYPTKPLESCVQDVRDVQVCLQGLLNDAVEIHSFTAGSSSGLPADRSGDLWPTSDNVKHAFETVTASSESGDFVYIHYSGHGTRKMPSGDYSNSSTGDLALVLLSEGPSIREQCMWGFELASMLKAMVDKGLVVTLVLDCCFSASVYRRDDSEVRCLQYNPSFDSETMTASVEEGLDQDADRPVYRDVSMLPNWLIKPDRYAILAACGPVEEALEPRFNGERRGALTYFLLRVIENVGLAKRHKNIYDHLCAKFKGSRLPQNPVLYGNQNQGFFGQVNSDITATVIPIVKKGSILELQAGIAHGVHPDDLFVLYPLGSTSSDPRSQGNSVVTKITRIRALTADLEGLDSPNIPVQTGWMARALTRNSLKGFPVQLASDFIPHESWHAALEERSLASSEKNDENFTFKAILNPRSEYKITDSGGNLVANLPMMPQDQTNASQLSSVLEHLARFQLVRNLKNEPANLSFQQSFRVQIFADNKTFEPGSLMNISHLEKATLSVENLGDKDLYVFIFDLGPFWQIDNINRGTYTVVTPTDKRRAVRGTLSKKLKMMIPEQMREAGYNACYDMVKILVTSQPTSFDLFQLPKLGQSAKEIIPDRGSPDKVDTEENWAAFDFPICISL